MTRIPPRRRPSPRPAAAPAAGLTATAASPAASAAGSGAGAATEDQDALRQARAARDAGAGSAGGGARRLETDALDPEELDPEEIDSLTDWWWNLSETIAGPPQRGPLRLVASKAQARQLAKHSAYLNREFTGIVAAHGWKGHAFMIGLILAPALGRVFYALLAPLVAGILGRAAARDAERPSPGAAGVRGRAAHPGDGAGGVREEQSDEGYLGTFVTSAAS
jgi:hypothetical protein